MKRNLITLSNGAVIDAYQISCVSPIYGGCGRDYFTVCIGNYSTTLNYGGIGISDADVEESRKKAEDERNMILNEWKKLVKSNKLFRMAHA